MLTSNPAILKQFPPMGIYEVLFSFLDSAGTYLGNPGTHPWAQGFPLTTQIPGGPALPSSVEFSPADMKYPPATGAPELLEAIRDYYNHFYGSDITTDNIAIFAGGRPGIYSTLSFLNSDNQILIEETEYTPYFDVLELLEKDYACVPTNEGNKFRPTIEDYKNTAAQKEGPKFVIRSNPCNPTGITWAGDELKSLVDFCSQENHGGIIDEAYEFFHSPKPVSAMEHIDDIDKTNLFVIGAATKGLQVPGMRTGWVIASKENIEIFRNFSSLAMGGVSRASQIYVAKLLELKRVAQSRDAISAYFGEQRDRYREAFEAMGMELYSGEGGFYHWGKLPGDLDAKTFNERLYQKNAAILPGKLCDMYRRGDEGSHGRLFRFSFGATPHTEFDQSIEIIKSCL